MINIDRYNEKLKKLGKDVEIIELDRTERKRGKTGKFSYTHYVKIRCKCGDEPVVLLSNLMKKDRNIPCICTTVLKGFEALSNYCVRYNYNNIIDSYNRAGNKMSINVTPISSTYRKFICQRCGRVFGTSVKQVLTMGEPICNRHKNRISLITIALKLFFEDSKIESINEYKIGRYFYDIYLPEYKILIEFDGQAWHTDLEMDKKKSRYAISKGYRIIRIRESGCPVIDDNKIETIEVQKDNYEETISKTKKYMKVECNIILKDNWKYEKNRLRAIAEKRIYCYTANYSILKKSN